MKKSILDDRMRDALVAASLRGIRQVKKVLHDGNGGHCAVGVIHLERHGWNEAEAMACFTQHSLRPCNTFNFYMMDTEIEKANDRLGWDFLTIARKL